ncbi:MAG: DEAD/DEAH box helicase [Aerococcus sp.]|nr:DEAD/DEAH box helicase [Aerococcus sp.]
MNDSILYPFQRELLARSKKNFLYAADTGSGKTLLSLHHYLKYGEGEPLLVIMPPAKYRTGDWEEEIKRVERTYGLKMNYQLERSSMLTKRWQAYKGYYVIVDECHQFKNPTSQRGKALAKLIQRATGFCLLSATPASNGWGDMINYFILFGFVKNKTQFNREYGVWGDQYFGSRLIHQVVDYQHKDQLKKWYQSFSLTVKKEDVLDLPPITFKKVTFQPSKDYQTILRDRVLEDVAYDTPAALMHGLREHANQKDKLDYLQMLLEGTEENVVVFYQYDSERQAIKNKIREKLIYEVNGHRQEIPKKADWDHTKNSLTLVQYAAGSAGIELQYANVIVYYTPTFSYQDYTQSLGRAYRNGQKKKVLVLAFCTEQTIETAVWQALKHKKDFDEQLYLITKLGGKECLD